MGFYGDADIAACLKDVGEPVTAGSPAILSCGALNLNDKIIVQDAQRGEVHATVPSVEVQTSAFPAGAIAIDSLITVAGVAYYVRDHDAPGDGAVTKLYLRRA